MRRAALARAAHGTGNAAAATQLAHRCLDLFDEIGNDSGIIDAIEIAAEMPPAGTSRRGLLASANERRR